VSHPLLTPRSIVSHVLVTAIVIGCVAAGQWQLDRLQTVREDNARFAQRLAEEPADLASLADPDGELQVDEAGLEFRRVEVRGIYRPGEEVLQRNQSYRNQTGYHVLTPLELEDGGVVLVRRGWVPSSLDEPPLDTAPPPEGQVEVVGVLERPVEQPTFGANDPEQGELERVFHTDTARLDRQVEGELFPMVLRIDEEFDNPTPDQLPFPVGSPELDEGSHLSYTVQWHSFAVIGVLGYGAFWFGRLRRTTVTAPDDDDGDDGGGGGAGRSPSPDRPLTGAAR
jgi:surfeit locus 1 family protein